MKNTILIFEGADLTGKSTLAKYFKDKYEWPDVKIRWDLVGDIEAETRGMANATIEILSALKSGIILDRSYFSIWAYGEALGYEVSFMPELIKKFSKIDNAKLVLLTTSAPELEKRFNIKPDLYFPLEVIQKANEKFPYLLNLLPENLPAIHIDTTDLSEAQAIEQIEKLLEE